jgi:uncharacterized SAM-binding protein YcdF (DUF218 family)
VKSLAFFLILLMIWCVGLLAFSARVDAFTPMAEPEKADGIVALTGVSADRIKEAMKLLEEGKAKRMLVSGVNRDATRDDIRGVARATRRIYDCCVDLGFQAADTLGNARETAAWVRAKGYDSLIVVTSDYHMPRSLLELHAALPGVKLTAYAVKTDNLDAKHWWRTAASARRMIMEYNKYLAILSREAFLSLGPKEDARADATRDNAAGGLKS